ncbi:MAG: ABC transporter substrate-binding protein [Limnochordia bacterium]
MTGLKGRRITLGLVLVLLLGVFGMHAAHADPDQVTRVWMPSWGGTGEKELKAWNDYARPFFPEIDKIQIVDMDDGIRLQRMELAVSSGDRFEATMIPRDKIPYYVEKGLLRPIDDLLEYAPLVKEWCSPSMWAQVTYEGKIYAVPNPDLLARWTFVTNTHILKKHGLDHPETIEDLEKVMQVLKSKDPRNPVIGFEEVNAMLESLVNPLTGLNSLWVKREDGTIIPFHLSSYGKTMARTLADWTKKGYLLPEWPTVNYSQTTGNWTAGRLKGWFGHVTHVQDDIAVYISENPDEEVEYGFTYGLQGPYGDKALVILNVVWTMGLTSFGDEDAQIRLMKFWDSLCKPGEDYETYLFCSGWGPPGMNFHYKWENGRLSKEPVVRSADDIVQWGYNRWCGWWPAEKTYMRLGPLPSDPLYKHIQVTHAEMTSADKQILDPILEFPVFMEPPGIWERYPSAKDYWGIKNWLSVASTVGDFDAAWNRYIEGAKRSQVVELSNEIKAYMVEQLGEAGYQELLSRLYLDEQ